MKQITRWITYLLLGIISSSMGDNIVSAKNPRTEPENAVIMTWYNGEHKERVIMALDEVAIFLDEPPGKALRAEEKEELRQQYHPQATVLEERSGPKRLFLKRPNVISKDQLPAHLKALKQLPRVRQVSPVFYITPNRDSRGRMLLTGEILVQFSSVDTEEQIYPIEKQYGLIRVEALRAIKNAFVYQVGNNVLEALETANKLYESGQVLYASPSWSGTIDLDFTEPTDPLFQNQWNFLNKGQIGPTGEDIKITNAWDTYDGSGTVIAIADYSGLELMHPDLKDRVVTGESWDYRDGNADPAPDPNETNAGHGTSVAGLAAATWKNHTGISGASPVSGLVGYRLDPRVDKDLADAFTRNNRLISIYNNSWGIPYSEQMLRPMQTFSRQAIEQAISQGRGGLGNIFVFSGGDFDSDDDNSNYDGYKNSRYTIAVAASNYNGERAAYSEKGANLLVNAPSSDTIAPFTTFGVPTTDLTDIAGYNQVPSSMGGDYYANFGGTSAAAPQVAGVIGLMLQANANLTWRDVQQILLQTAFQNHPGDAEWHMNGAHYPINHQYGFGREEVEQLCS